jgi:aryl-alcohol dehydrogenase-like predicted oxidoreductase
MRTITLGQDGPSIPVVGLGCMGMSEFYGPSDEAQSIDAIRHALDVGVTFLDTADAYGNGRNETLVGKAVRERRQEVVVATKFALVRSETGAFVGVSGRPDYVKKACAASLSRLGIDAIDLYYQHRVDPEVPIEDTVGAMAELVQEGKVRRLGLSECSPATLRRAHQVHPIAAVQTEYSLWSRDAEDGILDACAELGVAFVAYSPLGRGFLTGDIKSLDDLAPDDWRRNNPRFQGENLAKNLTLARAVQEIAGRRGITPAQLALAWVLGRATHITAIPGTRSAKRVDENAAAADIGLTSAELDALERAFPRGAAAGGRYPEATARFVER